MHTFPSNGYCLLSDKALLFCYVECVGTTLEELKKIFDWSAHQISNETLRALFTNGFTSSSALAQICESDLRYLRKHTDISPGQIVLLRGVIKNISKEEKEAKITTTQATSSEQETYLTDDVSRNHGNVSSENERISGGANIPVTVHLSNNQSYDGTLNVNLPDMSREQTPRLLQQTQNESESIQASNQVLEMSGTVSTEQTGAEISQIAIETSNSNTVTQTNSLTSSRNIPSGQSNSAFQQSFTTTSVHAAERNGGFRGRLELAQINFVNEAQQWNPIFPGKNKYAYQLK